MEPQKINLNLNTIVQNIDEKNNSANLLVEYDSLHQDNFLSAVLSKANYKNDLNCKIKSQEFVDQVNIFPSIKIDSTSDKKIEEFYEISFREETGKLMFKKKYLGEHIIKQDFNFKEFPFDSKIINMNLVNNNKLLHRYIIDVNSPFHSEVKKRFFYIKDANDYLAAWNLKKVDVSIKNFYPNFEGEYIGSETLNLKFSFDREFNYYIIKIIIPIFLILIVCWSVFWINIAQIESRLTISVVCLLALIAYNVIVSDTLPKIGYPTVMDYIILSSYVLGALSTILTVIFYHFHYNNNPLTRTEKYVRVTFPIFYLVIVFGIANYNIERLNTASMGSYIMGLLT